MANKTMPTGEDVRGFIDRAAGTEQRRADSFALLELLQKASGHPPKMWGPGIIGFGHYHYRYASGHEGDAPLIGFSPRKSAISLYVFTGAGEHEHLLEGLGKFKRGKACLYINKLSDIHLDKLSALIKATINYLQTRYNNS